MARRCFAWRWKLIELAQEARVLTITLNRPERRNALNLKICRDLTEAFDRAGSTENTKLHDALLKTDHSGVLGPFRFTAHRDPASAEGVVVLAIKNGKFDTLE